MTTRLRARTTLPLVARTQSFTACVPPLPHAVEGWGEGVLVNANPFGVQFQFSHAASTCPACRTWK
jgi:hypothetical protein